MAEVRTPAATAQIVRYEFFAPPDSALRENCYRIELGLTPRHASARARFKDHWSLNRFEKIGDVFLVPPDMDVQAKSDEDDPMMSIICRIESQTLLRRFDTFPKLTDGHLVECLNLRNANIRNLLIRLGEEVRRPGFASEVYVELTAELIAIELFRHGANIRGSQERGGLTPWQLRILEERLSEVREAPTLSELAALCGLSVRQLSRNFRRGHECSIGAYVANSQIEHARRLLSTDHSVTAIANTLGFSSSSNFCFAFRRATGMTPGTYRRTLLRH